MQKVLFLVILFSQGLGSLAQDQNQLEGRVEVKVEQVNTLRETLVSGVSDQPDFHTFKAVCSPVGMQIKQIKKSEGFMIRQASHKARNPSHAADALELEAIEKFQKDSELSKFWLSKGGQKHFFRRITVRTQCLACHGNKESRPDFIKSKFPQDKAYDFKVGDLRGIYHVQIFKEKQQRSKESNNWQ
jgi:hypothetical protein